MSEPDLTALKAASDDFHTKTALAGNTAAIAKQAIADKNDIRHTAETLLRVKVRLIKL